ncbi:PAS domain S-box protein [Alkalispirochaeta americana]|uniref:PAS domain S-box protein n=1 Tax=Alkalispirochaeta americana TaxID=159291 RepID=UPI0013565674|nr:PAS domain S-box protein [Alkalispirochaeta americana]
MLFPFYALPAREGAHRALIVSLDSNWPPFSFLDSQGNPRGVLVDIWRTLEEPLGRPVEFHFGSWPESLSWVLEGSAHVQGGLLRSPGRETFFEFSSPLLPLKGYLFVAAEAMPLTMQDLAGRLVGVTRGSFEEYYMERSYSQVPLRRFDNNDYMVQAALRGELVAFVADFPVANYLLDRYNAVTAFYPVHGLYSRSLRAGVRRGEPELRARIDAALAALGEEELRRLTQRWLRSETREVLPRWFWPFVGAGGLAVLLGSLALYNAVLRRQRRHLLQEVQRRTGAVRESEELFRTLSDHAAAGIFILRGSKLVVVNPAMVRIFGYSREDMLSMEALELVHPDQRELLRNRVRSRHDQKLVAFRYEVKGRTRSGETVWVELTAGKASYQGKTASIGTIFDITARKRAEERIQEDEYRLRSILENLPGFVYQLLRNPDGSIEYPFASDGLRSFGVTPEELQADPQALRRMIPRDDYRKLLRESERAARTMGQFQCQYRLILPDGTVRWVEAQDSPRQMADGRVLWTGLAVDITRRKRLEQLLQESEEKFRTIVENANDIIYSVTAKGIFTYVSPNWVELLGHDAADVLGRSLTDFVHPQDFERFWEFLDRVFHTRQKQSGVEYRIRHSDGSWRWHTSNASPYFDAAGRVAELHGIARDITEAKEAQEAREEAVALLHRVSQNVPGVIFKLRQEPDGRRSAPYVSWRVKDIFGAAPEDLQQDAGRFFDAVHPEDRSLVEEGLQAALEQGVPWLQEFRIRTASGSYRWHQGQASCERSADGGAGWYGYIGDVQERRDAQERFSYLALHDALTGLANRILFSDRVETALAAARREGESLALLFLDMDSFKPVNDTLGHAVGDALLQEVARRIENTLRESDTAARIGGDEFLLLLRRVDRRGALRVAEKVRQAVQEPCTIGDHVVSVTSSIGIALFPDHGESLTELSASADKAMYRSKREGRDTAALYDPALDSSEAG